MSESARLASWVAELSVDDIPEDARHEVVRCLVDWIGVAVAGSRDKAAAPMHAMIQQVAGSGPATVLGVSATAPAPFAALANGYFSHLHDYDDTFLTPLTTVHPSAPLWPALFAAAEQRPISGRDALVAFAAGFEAQNRAALAAGPAHYERGWHVTGTVGHFGAAAMAARARGLDAARVNAALGTAGTQAAGLKEVYGSMGKPLHPGKAAMDGLIAAGLAENGFTSTTTILEGSRGFLAVLSDEADASRITEGLGSRWTLRENGVKPYACGVLTHPTIEAVSLLRDREGLRPEDVTDIEATVHGYVSWVTAKDRPTTGLEGKFSIFHAAAVALVDGTARLAQFTDERVNDPTVRTVRDRVRITVDDTLPKAAARVRLTTVDGRVLTHTVEGHKGSSDNPMTDADLSDKALDLLGPSFGTRAAEDLVRSCWNLAETPDIAALIRACQVTP